MDSSRESVTSTDSIEATTPPGVSKELLQEASTTQRTHIVALVGLVVSVVLYVVLASQAWAPVWLSILLILVMGIFGLWYMFLNMHVFILKSERKRATKAAAAHGAAAEQVADLTSKQGNRAETATTKDTGTFDPR